MTTRNFDVAVIGAGIVGNAIALELAREKRKVVVLEQGEIGRAASWAAGGVLTPVHLAEYPGPLASFCVESQKRFEGYLQELGAPEVEYRVTGMIVVSRTERDDHDLQMLLQWKRERGAPAERLDAAAAVKAEPSLSPTIRGALLLPDIAQVRNHRLTRAIATAAQRLGVEYRTATEVTGFLKVPGRVNGLKTSKGDLFAGEIVVAAGAWSSALMEPLALKAEVHPVRGQMILLQAPVGTIKRVVLGGDRYFIPRADGKILLGSTVEEAGFESGVSITGLKSLLDWATETTPALGTMTVTQSWSGLRPATPDRLPYIGRSAAYQGLVLATGHYRNGILLGPLTGKIVADVIAGRTPPIDITPFHPDR